MGDFVKKTHFEDFIPSVNLTNSSINRADSQIKDGLPGYSLNFMNPTHSNPA
jgi:hypothetical protein